MSLLDMVDIYLKGGILMTKSEIKERTICLATTDSEETIREKIENKTRVPYGTVYLIVKKEDANDVYGLLDFNYQNNKDCFDLWFKNNMLCNHVEAAAIAQTIYANNH